MPRKRPPPIEITSAVVPERLYRPARIDGLAFETTDTLEDLPVVIGQQRARDALADAMDIRHRGYNVFMLGPPGVGKRSVVEEVLRARARGDGTPDDWCYVNNFDAPHRPRVLRLAPGEGSRLRAGMRGFIEDLRAAIPTLLESEEFRSRAEQIEARISAAQEQLFIALGEEATAEGLALLHTPAGFSLAPMREGEVLTPAQYEELPEAERERLQQKLEALQEKLQKAVRRAQAMQKDKRDGIRELTREMTLSVVGAQTEELKNRFADVPQVGAYLDAVQADILGNIDSFRRPPEGEVNPFAFALAADNAFRRYEVNVLVGSDDRAAGAPIVFEDYPTFPNLLGRIENVARLGTLVTDFSLIQAGSLHRANGGYLVIDAHKLLSQPFSWEGLKRALATGQLRPETMGHSLGLVTTAALEPEPIPIDVKVVLVGSRHIYYLLLALDPEFEELFKVSADFEDELVRSDEHEALYARLVATLAREARLLPLERAAVARVIEHASREAEDSERLSTQLEQLTDLLHESDLLARREGVSCTGVRHVDGALQARRERVGRIEGKLLEATLRGQLLVETSGAAVGRINALSVSAVGQSRFGHPTRITATTRLGDGEIIDIQREIDLGGPIHSKGVLTLASFLGARFSTDRPHCLSATLSFEQTYGEVEGDSASLAELVALLSSLAEIPVLQSMAVTGSVNQHGQVQPIGGVNEKIEGFFDVCAARGLTGDQGVVIPASNLPHLMLRQDVVAAVAAGRFRVHAVTHVDDAVALLTGLPSGTLGRNGEYRPGTVYFAVTSRLLELSVMRQAFANLSARIRRVVESGTRKKTLPEPAPPKPGKPPGTPAR
ncbi:MAG: ATP-binding protein [Betaproteobacteria bacterium]